MSKLSSNDPVIQRMDVIIHLLLERTPEGSTSTASKIQRLLSCGLSKSEVADIIGKPVNYVTAVTTVKKKQAKRSRK